MSGTNGADNEATACALKPSNSSGLNVITDERPEGHPALGGQAQGNEPFQRENFRDRSDRSLGFYHPTDFPESDGTFEWDSTTPILVEAYGGRGLRELRGWARNI